MSNMRSGDRPADRLTDKEPLSHCCGLPRDSSDASAKASPRARPTEPPDDAAKPQAHPAPWSRSHLSVCPSGESVGSAATDEKYAASLSQSRALVFLPFSEMHKSFFPSSFSAARPPNKVVTSSLDAFLPSLFPSLLLRLTPRRTHRPQMSSLRLPPSRLSTLLTLSIASRCYGSVHTGPGKKRFPGCENFVLAVAYHFCLALPEHFSQPGNHSFAGPCTYFKLKAFGAWSSFRQFGLNG